MRKQYGRMLARIKSHESQLLCIIGFGVIAVLSFVFGALHSTTFEQAPIIVHQPESPPVVITQRSDQDAVLDITAKDCMYVGSIKGKKYYPPSCSYARKIAKENLRCFISDQDAVDKGYKKSTSCK